MKKTIAIMMVWFVMTSCAGVKQQTVSAAPGDSGTETKKADSSTAPADELDKAIREASDYINKNVPTGSKVAILNVQSVSPALSDYIIDELIANAVNDKVFAVIDRQQLNLIRGELDFQYSGDVDDNSAQSIGKLIGAEVIISGAVGKYGDMYRMRIRALAVQTAQVQGQFNRNIPEGRTITALMSSTAVGYSAGTTPAARQTEQTATAQIQSVASAPAPQPRLQISESDLVGVWKGSYIAGQGETALMLSVYEERGAYIAIFDFYNLPGKSNSREGKYYMQVSYNKSREKFYLKGIEWIERPSGYGFADLEGTITRDVFSGFLSGSNNTFRVIRQETD